MVLVNEIGIELLSHYPFEDSLLNESIIITQTQN
jgi:hypothetical protein